MSSRAWVVTQDNCLWRWYSPFQCPLGLELLPTIPSCSYTSREFQCPLGLELLRAWNAPHLRRDGVSMPSRAWVVTFFHSIVSTSNLCFNALSGLSCYIHKYFMVNAVKVSMPSRAWVVTSNIFTEPIRFYVSMPSRAWVVTVRSVIMEYFTAFQCPLGLELLRQECPIF